jgi:hypothetical protein
MYVDYDIYETTNKITMDNIADFKKRLVVPSRVDPNLCKLTDYNAYASPSQMTITSYQSNSASPGSFINWTVPLNVSPNGVLSKDIYVRYQMDVTLSRVEDNTANTGWSNGDNCNVDCLGIPLYVDPLAPPGPGNGPSIVTEADGVQAWLNSPAINSLCSWPLQRASKNINIQFNGCNISTNTADYLPLYESLLSDDQYLNSYVSTSPVLRDGAPNFEMLFGKSKNPMNRYAENSANLESRSCIKYVVLPTGRSKSQVTVRCFVTEKLLCSPLATNAMESELCGFINTNNLILQMNLSGDLSTVWSCNAKIQSPPVNSSAQYTPASNAAYVAATPLYTAMGPPPSTISYSFVGGSVQLLLQQYTVPSYIPVEGKFWYPYNQIIVNNGQTFALTRDFQNIPGPSFSIQGVPRYLCLYMKPTTESAYQPNSQYALINKVNMVIGGQSGILSNSDSEWLYYLSQQSGSLLSYPEFSQYYGSMCFFDLAKVINLNDSVIVGQQGSLTFQAQITAAMSPFVKADDGVTDVLVKNYNLYYIFMYEALLSIDSNGVAQSYTNILTAQDKSDLMVDALETYTNTLAQNGTVQGGSFYSNMIGKVRNFLRPRIAKLREISQKFAPKVLSTLDTWGDVLPQKFSDGVRNVTESIQEAIEDAHKAVGEGIGFAALVAFLLKKYGPTILEKVIKYLQERGIVNSSGSGFTTGSGRGGNLGPSTGLGGRRISLR